MTVSVPVTNVLEERVYPANGRGAKPLIQSELTAGY
jgi:hypothetical protein